MNGITYFPSLSVGKKKQFIHTKHSRKVQSKSHFHMTMSDLINATLDSCRLDFYPISWFTFFITKGLMALCLLHVFPKYFYPFKHPIFTADYLCNWCIYIRCCIDCMQWIINNLDKFDVLFIKIVQTKLSFYYYNKMDSIGFMV